MMCAKRGRSLTGLEDFNDNALVGLRVDALIDFRVLASANLLDDFIVVLGPTASGVISKVLKEGGLGTYWNLTSKFS